MNRKEREKLGIATGKIRLTEKDVKRREEKAAQKRKEKKEKILVAISSLVALILIISGIVWFNQRQTEIAQRDEGFPPEVPYPTNAEKEAISNELILLETTMGDIYMELDATAAPRTSRNLRELVKNGFYDGVIFHRVIDDFMIQTGGYTTTSPKDPGYSFRDEINPLSLDLPDHVIDEGMRDGYNYDMSLPYSIPLSYGVVAMANAGANTNGSQFFIITNPEGTTWLEGRHTGFGRVVRGMEVAESIQKVATDEMDKPVEDIIITRASIVERADIEDLES